MVQWVIRSILHGGSIELLLIPASAPWHVLSCLWDGAYKRTLAANQKIGTHVVAAAGFLSCYLSGHLPYVGHHITVNKMC